MAVEARRLNLFPPQIISNRGMMMMNGIEGIGNAYGAPMGYGVVAPLSGTTTATETLVPMYGSAITEAFPAKTAAIKSDSGLSYAVPVSRKRPRDAINSSLQNDAVPNNRGGSLTFLGEDFSFQFQQQQLEIDRFIAQHTEKVRLEVEQRRKRYSRRIAAAVEDNVMKRLKAKEEEIEKMGKLNWALEERVKSLCVENQIWRDLAQTNEATANALRCNLEQVLAQVQDEQQQHDDAQSSCCGSNFDETAAQRNGGDDVDDEDGCIGASNRDRRMCRSCGKEESSVLLLPCRHLCLCTLCGSSLQTCPVCNSTQTATVHVNLSPS
ncbi:probable boi-related E3 ubiquitin-protein ligase 3 [Phtheirospermum japonicum]|uniref:Probable boi-related E3 ubiquitin-protein ligase 3 n=1 Tax=Phtheirospermum japonicum TaxID=374723 RepID=A0A830BIW7_9LAMI|nr:probable boi-related E3 ubiquitin-protein ligase 3 [Phtheirospermum japonicum]